MKKSLLINYLFLCILSLLMASCSSVSETVATKAVADVSIPVKGSKNIAVLKPVTDPSQPVFASRAGSLWDNMREHFKLEHDSYNPLVQQDIKWYLTHQSKLYYALNNSAPYLYYIYAQVQERKLPTEFVLLPIIESAYDPFATSNRGATGLWQLMPETATGYGLKHDWWYDGRRDVPASTDAALNYLSYLGNFFNGNWLLVLAAYNSGEGTVQQTIEYNASRGNSTNFWSLPLPRQTQDYVPRLLALATIIDHPARYGIQLPDIKDAPYLQAVKIDKEIPLNHIAKLAGMSTGDIEHLNSGYNHEETDPHMSNTILLPIDKISNFVQNLQGYQETVPDSSAITDVTLHVVHYKVKPGDTIAAIARLYGTHIGTLVSANSIRDGAIKPNQILVIPGHERQISNDSGVMEEDKVQDEPNQTAVNSYAIRKGDNLWSVAKKLGVSVKQIKAWNHINNIHGLKLGQVITINKSETEKASHSFSATSSHKMALRNKTYKVRHGDDLTQIASRFGVSLAKIKRANHLSTNNLKIGQTLTIPA